MKIKSRFVKAFLLGIGITFLSSGVAFASTEETNAAEPVDATILMVNDAEPVKAPPSDGDVMVITSVGETEEIMYKDPNAATSSDVNPDGIVTTPDDVKRDLGDGGSEPAMDPSIYETGVVDPVADGEVKTTDTLSEDDKIRTLSVTNANDGTPEGAQTMTTTAARDTAETSSTINYVYILGVLMVLAIASFTLRGRIVSSKK